MHSNEEHSVNVTSESMGADNPASDDGDKVNIDEREITDRSPIEPRQEQVHNSISINVIEEHFANVTAERTVAVCGLEPVEEKDESGNSVIPMPEAQVEKRRPGSLSKRLKRAMM
jgi:hypothetical protein